MTLLSIDGASYYDDGTMTQRVGTVSTPQVQPTSGLFNSVHRAGRWFCNSQDDEIHFLTTNTDATIIVQMHFHPLAQGDDIVRSVVRLRNNSEAINHVTLETDRNGRVEVRRGNTTQIALSNPGVYVMQRWSYMEFKTLIHDSAGTVDLKINGITEISETGLDTRNAGTNAWTDQVIVNCDGSGNDTYFANIIILNGAGSAPFNDFLGERRIYTLFPTGNDTINWTRSSTTSTNWELVDETDPNGDTDYVETSSTGIIDRYSFESLSTGVIEVNAVAVNFSARDTTTAGPNIRASIDSTGSIGSGATITLSSVYSIYQTIFENDPATTDWSASAVNALVAGPESIA